MITVGSDEDATVSQGAARVVFVVTVRNNKRLLNECLRSVASQDYHDVRCVVVDDASEDGTAEVARMWAARDTARFTVVTNKRRVGKMANFVAALEEVDTHDVVVELDGDDRLLEADAAADLARLHHRVDLVWSQHRVERGPWTSWTHWRSTDVPLQLRSSDHERKRVPWGRAWYPGHLRSFKRWAFDRIDRADLKVGGRYVPTAADVAYFCPLFELTPGHLRYFYDRELCTYNITAFNDHFSKERGVPEQESQWFVAQELFSRPPYPPAPSPLWTGLLDARSAESIRAACARQLSGDPSTRILLAAPAQLVDSWHPRVQVLRLPDHVPPDNAVDVGLPWLLELARQFATGQQECSAVPGLPLVELL